MTVAAKGHRRKLWWQRNICNHDMQRSMSPFQGKLSCLKPTQSFKTLLLRATVAKPTASQSLQQEAFVPNITMCHEYPIIALPIPHITRLAADTTLSSFIFYFPQPCYTWFSVINSTCSYFARRQSCQTQFHLTTVIDLGWFHMYTNYNPFIIVVLMMCLGNFSCFENVTMETLWILKLLMAWQK